VTSTPFEATPSSVPLHTGLQAIVLFHKLSRTLQLPQSRGIQFQCMYRAVQGCTYVYGMRVLETLIIAIWYTHQSEAVLVARATQQTGPGPGPTAMPAPPPLQCRLPQSHGTQHTRQFLQGY
jgi:hypothetical protein